MTRGLVLRLSLLAALVVGLLVAARVTGLGARLSTAGIRQLLSSAGVWGALLFVAAFALGQLIWIPASVFFAAGVLAYGRVWGGAVSYVAAMFSVSMSFLLVRAIGGQPLAAIRNPRMRRLLARLDQRPLSTVFILRTLFWASPALNYALALSALRYRDYLAGTALGLVLPVAAASVFFGLFFG